MTFLLLLLSLFFSCQSFDTGRGTAFAVHHDRFNRGRLACLSPRRAKLQTEASRKLFREGLFVAHRQAPCWSIVKVCSRASGLCERATVADRGPRHALIDLNRHLSRKLRHDGELVLVQFFKE